MHSCPIRPKISSSSLALQLAAGLDSTNYMIPFLSIFFLDHPLISIILGSHSTSSSHLIEGRLAFLFPFLFVKIIFLPLSSLYLRRCNCPDYLILKVLITFTTSVSSNSLEHKFSLTLSLQKLLAYFQHILSKANFSFPLVLGLSYIFIFSFSLSFSLFLLVG
jgi:hypothetical protein